jgi:preprotein translocase subunit YajC
VKNFANLFLLLLIPVMAYVLMIRPAKANRHRMMEVQKSLRPGMQVRTFAGLFATVRGIEDEAVVLEIAPGVRCRYLKGAVAAIVTSPEGAEPSQQEAAAQAHNTEPAKAGGSPENSALEEPKVD